MGQPKSLAKPYAAVNLHGLYPYRPRIVGTVDV